MKSSLNSMHAHPTPQSRDRLYFVAWKRGNRRPNLRITPLAYCGICEKQVEAVQVWKKPGHCYGKYRRQYLYCCPHCVTKEVTPYYYTAATAIDWSCPTPRIADRKKPLAEKTMERLAAGLEMLMHPSLVDLSHGNVRCVPVEVQPFSTQTSYDTTALVCPPFLMDHLGEYRPRSRERAMSTICARGNHHSLIIPHVQRYILPYHRTGKLTLAEEAALPTLTTVDRHAVVTATTPSVEDCGFRMLMPREIQAAMAFPADYVLTGTRREQVEQLGNAVTPPVMKLLMERVIAAL